MGKVIDVTWLLTIYELLILTEWIWLRGIRLDAGGSDVYLVQDKDMEEG
jgi:hypothetical protein